MISSLSVHAAELLRDKVLSGEFPPGSRLPSERDLSEQLGISRTALRDALQNLKATGLIEPQVGRGWFVTDDRARSSAAALNWLSHHRQDIGSLNEVRQLLEPRAVEMIPAGQIAGVTNATARVVEDQRKALRRGDHQAAAKLDGDFHSALVAATPNEPLRVLAEELISLARVHSLAVYDIPGAAENSVHEHKEIVAALAAAEPRRAATLLRKHSRSGAAFALRRIGAL